MIALIATRHAGVPLCFDGVAERYRQALLYVRFPLDDTELERALARSDAAIMMRQLLEDEAQRVVHRCRALAIPLYYLIDDNFIVLGDEGWEAWRSYTRERVAGALADFAGVLCTSTALAEYYRALPLAAPVGEMRPVFNAAKLRPARTRETRGMRVGFIGGPNRAPNLREHIMPALAAFATDCSVELFFRAMPETEPAGGMPFATTAVPYAPYNEFLARWGELDLDVLVHARADTANTEYKTNSVLLTALYLGAVPIVPTEPPFRDVSEAEGVVKVEGDRASWERALRRVQPPEVRGELLSRLETFCRPHFAAGRNEAVLQRMLDVDQA